jgi:hypothetical protein
MFESINPPYNICFEQRSSLWTPSAMEIIHGTEWPVLSVFFAAVALM